MKRPAIIISALSLIFILTDQISKILVLKFLESPVPIIGNFFTLQFSKNTGIAFSIDVPFTLLIIINFALLAIIAIFATQELDLRKKISLLSIAMIIGGGLGNLIDRLYLGYVVDFISIGKWPIFNIADIYVTLGVLLLLAFYNKIKRLRHKIQ